MTGLLSRMSRRFLQNIGTRQVAAVQMVDLGSIPGPLYVIGDIHGCRSLLVDLLHRIEQDAAQLNRAPLIVPLGDVIDRGPDTAGVLDLLSGRPLRQITQAILGNHERLMLDFLRDPHRHAGWLELGGFETLRSYGLALTRNDLMGMSNRRAYQTVMAHVPDEHIAWLSGLPHGLLVNIGGQDFALTHAGYDPSIPMDRQSEDVLLWGRGGKDGSDALRLVQGHVIVDEPDPDAARIRIDTGAWRTGRLTCLRLVEGSAPTLVTVTPSASPQGTQEKGKNRGDD